MSHFAVLVVGEHVDDQLAPYHEFECTGHDDEYVQDVDITDQVVEQGTDLESGAFSLRVGLEYFGLEEKVVSDESEIDRAGRHKYGYAIVRCDKLIKAVDRTNPNKKWDWYEVGGRWSGYFTLKRGGAKADSALKGEIDFDGMRDAAALKAGRKWDRARALMGAELQRFVGWETMRDVVHGGDVVAARHAFHAQPAKLALAEDEELCWSSVEEFSCERDEYVRSARERAISTFAIVKDGFWSERGHMGWWAIVSDEKDRDAWNREFDAMLDVLPDDIRLTVVDCHI